MIAKARWTKPNNSLTEGNRFILFLDLGNQFLLEFVSLFLQPLTLDQHDDFRYCFKAPFNSTKAKDTARDQKKSSKLNKDFECKITIGCEIEPYHLFAQFFQWSLVYPQFNDSVGCPKIAPLVKSFILFLPCHRLATSTPIRTTTT